MPLANPIGFAFMSSAGFTTPPANVVNITLSDIYPTEKTIGSVTLDCGWVTTAPTNALDTNASVPKLAGINYAFATTQTYTFQVDLPDAEELIIRAAFGWIGGIFASILAEFYDDATLIATVGGAGIGTSNAGEFYDATGVLRGSGGDPDGSDWLENNAGVTHTFASTTFSLDCIDAGDTNALIAYLQFESPPGGGGGGTGTFPDFNGGFGGMAGGFRGRTTRRWTRHNGIYR